MADRTYVVGLPVIITVRDDGWVEAHVDLSEAGQTIRKDDLSPAWEPQEGDDMNPPTEEQIEADALTVDRWSDLNELRHGEFAPPPVHPPAMVTANPNVEHEHVPYLSKSGTFCIVCSKPMEPKEGN